MKLRSVKETHKAGQASSVSIGYEYYADGRRKKLIYSDGTFITYEYNAKGWLEFIKDDGTNSIVSYCQYDDTGRRTQRTMENSTYTVYEYDSADQLTNLAGRLPSGDVFAQYQYATRKINLSASSMPAVETWSVKRRIFMMQPQRIGFPKTV